MYSSEAIQATSEIIAFFIKDGEVSEINNKRLVDKYYSDRGVSRMTQEFARNLGLIVTEGRNALYASPALGSRLFTYSNQEIKDQLGYGAKEAEQVLAFFIIKVLILKRFHLATPTPTLSTITIEAIIEETDKKIKALKNKAEELAINSSEMQIDFKMIVERWQKSKDVTLKIDDEDYENTAEFGWKSQSQIVKTTMRFLEYHKLVDLDENLVHLSDRFVSLIFSVYNNDEVKSEILRILRFVDSLEEE